MLLLSQNFVTLVSKRCYSCLKKFSLTLSAMHHVVKVTTKCYFCIQTLLLLSRNFLFGFVCYALCGESDHEMLLLSENF